jgi:hypothetical protein
MSAIFVFVFFEPLRHIRGNAGVNTVVAALDKVDKIHGEIYSFYTSSTCRGEQKE